MPDDKLQTDFSPSIGWLTWVVEHLDSQGLDEDGYQLQMRNRLLDGVCRELWSDLLQSLRSEDLSMEDIGKRLRYHRGTINRWVTGDSHPDSNALLGAIVFVARREIDSVGFASQPNIVTRAVRNALTQVQELDLRAGGRRRLSLDQLRIAMVFHEQKEDADVFLPDGESDRTEQLRVTKNVARQFQARFDKMPKSEQVFDTIREWAPAFALFLVGLPEGFQVRDEISTAGIH